MIRIHTLALAAFAVAATLSQAQPASPPDSGNRLVVGGTVRQVEPITGDLFSFGGEVEIAGPVMGDLVLAGGSVRLTGPVSKDVSAAGGNVVVAGKVGGDANLAGGNVDVASTAVITGDLHAAGGDVNIRGPVNGNVRVAGGDVLIDTTIGGDVHAASGELRLGPNARIAGQVVHSGANLRRDPAAEVAGGTVEKKVRRHVRGERHGYSAGWGWTLGIVALAALLAGAFPAASRRIGAELRASPGQALLFGFLVLACVPVAVVIFTITIIGIPVAIVALLVYLLLLLVAYAASGVMLGDAALAKWRSQDAADTAWRIGAAVVAMLAVSLVGRVPVIGGLVVFAALLLGIGAIVMGFAHRKQAPAPA